MSDLGGTPENPDEATVEIGGQVMTAAQFNAARYPLLHPDPGPIADDTELPTAPPSSADIEPPDVDWPTLVAHGLVAFQLTREYVGEEVLPALPGWSWFDWSEKANAALAQPEPQSNLVDHARRELALLGEDEWTINGVVRIVRAFADMGHSGGSAFAVTEYLERLLRFQPLTDITDDPDDWIHHGEDVWGEPGGIWQCRRNSEAFSRDGGTTYYLLSERAYDDEALEVTPIHIAKAHRAEAGTG